MDAYFCYIHRKGRPTPEFHVLTCDTDAELDLEVLLLAADYPEARMEIFLDDEWVKTVAGTPASPAG